MIAESLEDATVDSAFAYRVRMHGVEVAVRCGDDALTFAELDRRARRLAAELRGRGVRPEVPVGIAIERSLDMVVAIVGTVLAGGRYLKLDPSHPAERTANILTDSATPSCSWRATPLPRR
ncbi:MAG: AMP-binding protein [Acidimicrobiales bacterium]